MTTEELMKWLNDPTSTTAEALELVGVTADVMGVDKPSDGDGEAQQPPEFPDTSSDR